ncbi:MAG: hypothetical protein JXK07_14830 [Spirochaetes bacterium]|nr:hypothetical protein [Spirochaetota bacterium]MBN2769930.1 hypothetical protein [Spirochaetota bacterium]
MWYLKKSVVNNLLLAAVFLLISCSGSSGNSKSDIDKSDPVTVALTGQNNTYNVGPDQKYEEPDTVPWASLTAGDVVNIYYREDPYRWKIAVRGQGTEETPIIINGVTDASGNRPKFDFDGATTASGCNQGGDNNIYDTDSVWSLEDYAGIMIKGDFGNKPSWITVKNLELYGANAGASFTNLLGEETDYTARPAAIWMQPSSDVLIENCVIYDNAFGIFTMAKDGDLNGACERIVVRNNRLYENGLPASYGINQSYLVHNLYIQSVNPVIEGNYIGKLRTTAQGSSYKSRSSGEIFRYNYVVSSLRAVDWVYSEEQEDGIASQTDYGIDYAYGNVIINYAESDRPFAGYPIHYGGDNEGEQEDNDELHVTSNPYRAHLYFYHNTVINILDQADQWNSAFFDLSLRGTRVDAWNNIFSTTGTSNTTWLQYSGIVNLAGGNLVHGIDGDAHPTALELNYSITEHDPVVTDDPGFTDFENYDFRLDPDSAAVGRAAAVVPDEFDPDTAYAHLPVIMQPIPGKNGMNTRETADDLGAFESE